MPCQYWNHMNKLFHAAFLALIGYAAPVLAQDNPVVVELYTSQGCSSCPPADALMHDLAKRDDVIALALHVDYWDYIGWKDPFAVPAHADRQRAYAAAGNRRTIYTPEMIVNGTTDIVGAKPMKLADAIAMHGDKPVRVEMGLERTGDKLRIKATPKADLNGPLTVHMLRYTPYKKTKIKRGENRGKTLAYSNIVADWKVIGEWDTRTDLSMEVDITGDRPAVVILQRPEAGPILAAARLR